MASLAFLIIQPIAFFFRILLKKFNRNPRYLRRKSSNVRSSQFKFQKYPSICHRSDLSNQTLIFNVEGALLKSSSLFPYFMLVAFEAGGLLRALALLMLYPLICLLSYEKGLKIMVMVCFFGIKKESFRVGTAVLPKFFLEDVGLEGFEVLRRCERKVGVTEMPQVMIESFLRDYLQVEYVVGRQLKVVCGYYVGLMEEKRKDRAILEGIVLGDPKMSSNIVGFSKFDKLDHQMFSQCKEIYLVSETDKRSWHQLQRDKYPKPLIFHDGRLAVRPTPLTTLALFMWVPFGVTISILRIVIALSLPFSVSIPILAFTGLRLVFTPSPKCRQSNSRLSPKPHKQKKGLLYVCNHRTLLDPLGLSFILKRPITAVTYSLSRMSEILAPIKTVRLTRDRDQDAKMMEKLLSQGDLVVCPEGTTCREPYLLRFSPLFAEMSDDIVPVAVDAHVDMFYGTTAAGFKCLDPIYFLMNPFPKYTVNLSLGKVCGSSTCRDGNESRFDVANHVQSLLGEALGFECTMLTRKDKYLILAGNEGIVSSDCNKRNH
ncbi:Phospholipid/glycerol acyltransferase [Dillenia turbinata]|uniref:Phospholipid/glycerol acyltransferase n=1 Tax=Dillenia turbinata TaxID=194707 RepID=A0AAN8W8D9_9MAGN